MLNCLKHLRVPRAISHAAYGQGSDSILSIGLGRVHLLGLVNVMFRPRQCSPGLYKGLRVILTPSKLRAVLHACDCSTSEAKEADAEDHPWLCNTFEASLGHMKPSHERNRQILKHMFLIFTFSKAGFTSVTPILGYLSQGRS